MSELNRGSTALLERPTVERVELSQPSPRIQSSLAERAFVLTQASESQSVQARESQPAPTKSLLENGVAQAKDARGYVIFNSSI